MNCCTKFWLYYISGWPNTIYSLAELLALHDTENITGISRKYCQIYQTYFQTRNIFYRKENKYACLFYLQTYFLPGLLG
jgi:hypothetical protein